MRLSEFDYNLPPELIAQFPLKERSKARLLVVERKRESIEHVIFEDVARFFSAGDLFVLNDTRVMPCRLLGLRATGAKVDCLLLEKKEGFNFRAYLKPGRLKAGEKILFAGGKLRAQVNSRDEISFEVESVEQIYSHGVMPLPPYIKRTPQEDDFCDYQTVYARNPGAVAAPTAGLHFTRDLLAQIQGRGINLAYLTLHVGTATFKPVKEEDITRHLMDEEYFEVSDNTKFLVDKARENRMRVCAVGTTSCRALESCYSLGKKQGYTDMFIYPGYNFKAVDCLLTNFHLPRTTLFMLICAFAGSGLMQRAYREAIDKKYRFYSYGDAMLIL